MAANKNTQNQGDVHQFLNALDDDRRRDECFTVLELMSQVTKLEPRMWGASMVGFGSYHYKYASGREGEWFLTGFSPRKQALTLYIISGFSQFDELMARLGNYKTGKSCLYVKRLEDIDLGVLKKLVRQSVAHLKKQYPTGCG
ncbi:DUF1801 domain-containing protein [Exilibacterium tricleocarpae]|uniref:DUF1801 domain-containing protein n=1 Tax=Exilibacterium tricleocarpae TaxID=2591008 RepID=A0A545T8I2_9GAMM|nr:DUF1801 domain-containing protein [Exilibacterium tricleocarpae]TQV73533.1 DUF1801 domain-containing protein [Exilibacterium tricleocarpae]